VPVRPAHVAPISTGGAAQPAWAAPVILPLTLALLRSRDTKASVDEAMRTIILAIIITVAGALAIAIACVAIFIAFNWAPERSVDDLRARWAQPPSDFIDVAGLKVHVRDEGPRDDPSPIVLLHGSGSSLHAWDGWADILKRDRRVIRFDLAGFGLTGPSSDRRYSPDLDVAFVVAVLDKLGVARCVLGGNSLGGNVAWRTAAAHPTRVEKLILVDAAGYPFESEATPLGVRLMRLPVPAALLEHTLPRFLVEEGLRNIYGDPSKVTQEQIERSIEITQRAGNRRALLDRSRQRRPPGNDIAKIAELKVPTLIIWGGRDRLIPLSNAHRFHRDIAGSMLVIFDDLGHAPEEEDPARSVAPVRRFVGLKSADTSPTR
jgi:pimeloyl-ACP methyl ester carboxylesterase